MNESKIVAGGSVVSKSCLVVSLVLMLAGVNASAALTGTFGPDVPDFTQTITLDMSADATINGVKFTMTLEIYDGLFEFDNDASTAANVAIDLDAFAALSSTDVTVPAGATATVTFDKSVILAANDGDSNRGFNTGGTDYASINTGIHTATFSWNVAAVDVSDYIGAGTFAVDVNVSQMLKITADSGVAINRIPVLAKGDLAVEYLPEPASLTLFGLGGLLLRKRK